jgi:DNA-binding transcriptional ArsR family regulator
VSGSELVLEALGNGARRQIMVQLANGPRAVRDISVHPPISRPAVSRHLRILRSAHLVEFTEEGTRSIYQLKRTGFNEAKEWLDSMWDEALRRFAFVAENTSEDE